MKGHGTKYPHKREQAVLALLTQPSIGEAAQAAGVSEVTLWRWLQKDEFKRAYREAKRRAVQQAIAQLQHVTGEAVNTLKSVMTDGQSPPSTRVTAARVILEMGVKAVEMEDLAARVERLEQSLER